MVIGMRTSTSSCNWGKNYIGNIFYILMILWPAGKSSRSSLKNVRQINCLLLQSIYISKQAVTLDIDLAVIWLWDLQVTQFFFFKEMVPKNFRRDTLLYQGGPDHVCTSELWLKVNYWNFTWYVLYNSFYLIVDWK